MQLLQECDLAEHQHTIVHELMRNSSWQMHHGAVTDISKEDGKRRGRRVTTCVNSSEDTSVKFDIADPDYQFLCDSGRWVEVTMPTSQKGHYITVANFYGIAGAGQGGEDFRQNETFLAAAGRRAASFRNHPYFVSNR
jgi:hypothetical protein